ncbi:hypothetical protein L2E82_05242 [Cichorium intybus]|uniref:Uncharacterized protein n=1 Tax=Cichorium intybus TaxID=13427 RepID=A0ACB9H939_CICIN|nr:hypothetical protein L2E82_05242 [Cichorium intybus]
MVDKIPVTPLIFRLSASRSSSSLEFAYFDCLWKLLRGWGNLIQKWQCLSQADEEHELVMELSEKLSLRKRRNY